MSTTRAFLTATAAILIACGPPPPPQYGQGGGGRGPGGKPGWIDGKSGKYSDVQYLTGVGRGPSRGACDADARAALSKIFNAKIHQVSQEWQRYFSKVSSSGHKVQIEAMSVGQLTRVSTDKVLKGSQIAEHWLGEGTHHCLATLERFPTARRLREEIARIDAVIKVKVQQGDSAPNDTAKFMAYARAMEKMQEREALNTDLRIVDPRGAGVPPPVKWADLVGKFTGAKGRVRVGLRLQGTKASKIQTCMAEEFGKQGLEVLENTSDVDVMIHGKLTYEKAGFIRGSHMVRADVQLRLSNVENGRTLAAFTDTIKVGRTSLQQSIQLAVFKLCQQVVPKLTQKIRASFGR